MRVWLRPSTLMVLLSLVLHAVMLGFPLPESDSELASMTPAEQIDSDDTIAVVALSRQELTPEPTPQRTPEPEPEPISDPPQPVSQPAEPLTPISVPSPQSTLEPPVDSEPLPEPEAIPEPEPELEPEPEPQHPLQDPDFYVHNAKSTGEDNGRDEYVNWATPLFAQGMVPIERKEPVVEVPYLLEQCLNPEPAEGFIGLVVRPDGEIESKEILGSTGYDVLDNEALELVEVLDLSDITEQAAFTLPVKVQDCSG